MNIQYLPISQVPTPAEGYIYPFVDTDDNVLKAKKADGTILIFGGAGGSSQIPQALFQPILNSISSLSSSVSSLTDSVSSHQTSILEVRNNYANLVSRIDVLQDTADILEQI